MRFSSKERGSVLTLRHLYRLLAMLEKEDILSLVKSYVEAREAVEVVSAVEELGFLDFRKLAALIVWIASTTGLKVSNASLVEDLETGELQFVGVHLEGCDWEEWKTLSRVVKEQLISEGFEDIAGKVAIVCRQALRTRRS